MTRLDGIASEQDISTAIADLQSLAERDPVTVAAAILILKNELAPLPSDAGRRRIVFEERFALPGRVWTQLRSRLQRVASIGVTAALWEILVDLAVRLAGRDGVRFRDRCDRAYFRYVVPVIEEHCGPLADRVMNTVNEAIINYAEHGFRPWALHRQVHLHLFATDGDLAYALVRPAGLGLRRFDPLTLTVRQEDGRLRKRGWGHTLLMERALFLSFDRAPRRRGMMIVIGDRRAAART